ncbi:MAG: hypothetical protein V1729_01200 [Candidatus Woesearchaeota archaeon]
MKKRVVIFWILVLAVSVSAQSEEGLPQNTVWGRVKKGFALGNG